MSVTDVGYVVHRSVDVSVHTGTAPRKRVIITNYVRLLTAFVSVFQIGLNLSSSLHLFVFALHIEMNLSSSWKLCSPAFKLLLHYAESIHLHLLN